jgi:hypothetical protein
VPVARCTDTTTTAYASSPEARTYAVCRKAASVPISVAINLVTA